MSKINYNELFNIINMEEYLEFIEKVFNTIFFTSKTCTDKHTVALFLDTLCQHIYMYTEDTKDTEYFFDEIREIYNNMLEAYKSLYPTESKNIKHITSPEAIKTKIGKRAKFSRIKIEYLALGLLIYDIESISEINFSSRKWKGIDSNNSSYIDPTKVFMFMKHQAFGSDIVDLSKSCYYKYFNIFFRYLSQIELNTNSLYCHIYTLNQIEQETTLLSFYFILWSCYSEKQSTLMVKRVFTSDKELKSIINEYTEKLSAEKENDFIKELCKPITYLRNSLFTKLLMIRSLYRYLDSDFFLIPQDAHYEEIRNLIDYPKHILPLYDSDTAKHIINLINDLIPKVPATSYRDINAYKEVECKSEEHKNEKHDKITNYFRNKDLIIDSRIIDLITYIIDYREKLKHNGIDNNKINFNDHQLTEKMKALNAIKECFNSYNIDNTDDIIQLLSYLIEYNGSLYYDKLLPLQAESSSGINENSNTESSIKAIQNYLSKINVIMNNNISSDKTLIHLVRYISDIDKN